jgi:hypothetical protein
MLSGDPPTRREVKPAGEVNDERNLLALVLHGHGLISSYSARPADIRCVDQKHNSAHLDNNFSGGDHLLTR